MIEKPQEGDFVSISSNHPDPDRVFELRDCGLPEDGTPHQGVVLKVMDVPGTPYGKMYEVFTCGTIVIYVQGFWKFKILSRANEEFNK